MSVWTHVNGVIRFDGIAALGDSKPDCGNMAHFEDSEEVWDKCDIPCGSEGSLTINIWENPDETCLARWTVTIFGDLRDYDNDDEIIEYFNRITKDNFIRDGLFSINGSTVNAYMYEQNLKKFEKI